MNLVERFLRTLRMGPVADKTGELKTIMSVQLPLFLDCKCQFLTFGLLFYICGFYIIFIIIIIIININILGIYLYFTYRGRGKINFNWILNKQLVKP